MYTIHAGKKREEGEEERVQPAFQSLDHMEGMLAHWEYIHVNCNFLEKKEIPLAMRPFFFLRLILNYPNIYFIGSQCLPVLKPLYLHITDLQKVTDINFSALLRYNRQNCKIFKMNIMTI